MARKTKPMLWQRAASFAAKAHEHGYRSDSETPYFSHCARVATVLIALFGCTDEVAVASAFLHDVIEDTGKDRDEIEQEFGREVAACVAALTKNGALPEAQREREYDAGLRRADWRARLVKLADVYDNWMDADARRRPKVFSKARRAIALAKGDASTHRETAVAIRVVQAAIGR